MDKIAEPEMTLKEWWTVNRKPCSSLSWFVKKYFAIPD